MEVYHNLFSGFLEKKLAKVINQKSLNKSPGECLAILTIPAEESFAKKQEKDFLKLVSQINRNSRLKRLFQDKSAKAIIKKLVGNSFNKKIDQHIIGYCWVNYNYEGPAMDKEFLVDLLKNALKVFSPEQKIKEIESRDKEKIQKQSQLMQDLKPDKFLRRSIKLAKEFVALKSLRKESIFHASYASDKTRSEASRRLKISLNQCRSMLPEELIKALEFGQINRAELRAREKEVAYICDDGREKIYTGGQARKLSQQLIIQEKVKEVSQIQGTVASPGQASGLVKIIRHVKDMSKMHPGDILVAMATNPNFVPAMKKAAAIVTDMGGLTCHAAIVSRELSVPCVVGTKFATKVLKDGDMVEVDAEKGIIRILK
ncbi:hypothetical protein KJ590_01420 [Patescibacteria group bacterium]|nr:hypothetical protein [Patescibacteria group bacterium]MBU4142643.1 hypothetical protein [Patescibacteria group bacterium]